MSVAKRKGPVFDPGLCRCCGNMKKCRVLNIEYESLGKKEVYSDMIMDCFGLLLSHLDGSPSERLVCAVCVTRIRDALNFRVQVLKCEDAFLQMKLYDSKTEKTPRNPHMVDILMDDPPKYAAHDLKVVKTELVDALDLDNQSDGGEPLADMNDSDDEQKPHIDQDSNSSEPILKPVSMKKLLTNKTKLPSKKIMVTRSRGAARLARQMLKTKQILAEKFKQKAKIPLSKTIVKPRPWSVTPGPLEKSELQMSKIQQQIREKDPNYKRESNTIALVEFSYVCPFKCRHNHLLCYYCGEYFPDPILLREHTLKKHNPKKFHVSEHKSMVKVDFTRIDCRLCSVKIDSFDDFRSHITSVHGKKYYFDSGDSVLPFKLTREELKCALCEVSCAYFHALNKHMNEHFRNYVCETCGLGFVDHARFLMHQQRHNEGEYPCPTCGKIFKAQFNRDLHMDRVHRKKGRVYCPKCDVRLMSYPQKMKHLVEVHGEQPLSLPCDSCERVFDSRRSLTIHKRKEHLKDYRYECQCCGQKFFTRFALNNHMPTHTGERNFKCKVCEKSYPRLKTLNDHMRIHTNDRRYRCHVCGQAFIQNCSLKGHMKSQHPEYG